GRSHRIRPGRGIRSVSAPALPLPSTRSGLSMPHEVLDRIVAMADTIAADADASDNQTRLTDDMAAGLRGSGIIRMLQRKSHGGYEAHPREFAETVMGTASIYGSAGWIGGIVGVHPWQLAFADPRVQDEVLGEDCNTWMASPYMP